MNDAPKNVLIIVTSDPRSDGRAAEAVRIAAGIGGWEKVAVTLCLCGEARRPLDEPADDFINGEIFEQYLPVLLEEPSRVCVLDGGTPAGQGQSALARLVTVRELAAMGRKSESVLRF
jgi:hypothetical protein